MFDAPADRSLPIACTLGPADLPDRRREWQVLLARGAASIEPTDHGVRIALAPEASVAAELRRLADLESDCCAFARWTVHARDDRTVLDVESEGAGIDAVRAMFGQAVSG